VIYEIWRAISAYRGAISAGYNVLKIGIDSKKQFFLLWIQNIWCPFDSMFRNKVYRAHDIGLVT